MAEVGERWQGVASRAQLAPCLKGSQGEWRHDGVTLYSLCMRYLHTHTHPYIHIGMFTPCCIHICMCTHKYDYVYFHANINAFYHIYKQMKQT